MKTDEKTYVLTRGNGHAHVFVIRVSKGDTFIALDDLAVSRAVPHRMGRACIVILAILWVILLMMVGGMEQDTWFLLGVGVIGMAHNVVVAGFKRQPAAHGIPVREDESMEKSIVDDSHVFPAINEAERISPGVGLTLIPAFFPDGLRTKQEAWRTKTIETLKARKAQFADELIEAQTAKFMTALHASTKL